MHLSVSLGQEFKSSFGQCWPRSLKRLKPDVAWDWSWRIHLWGGSLIWLAASCKQDGFSPCGGLLKSYNVALAYSRGTNPKNQGWSCNALGPSLKSHIFSAVFYWSHKSALFQCGQVLCRGWKTSWCRNKLETWPLRKKLQTFLFSKVGGRLTTWEEGRTHQSRWTMAKGFSWTQVQCTGMVRSTQAGHTDAWGCPDEGRHCPPTVPTAVISL